MVGLYRLLLKSSWKNLCGRLVICCLYSSFPLFFRLVFGIGGMAFVYLIAPLIDNWVKEHLNKKLSAACLVLLLLFGADVVYSHFEPNVGEGVTQ